jgi:hypothetical protein
MEKLDEALVRSQIKETKIKTFLLLCGSLVILFGGAEIAFASRGPAADIVFYVAVGVGGLGTLIFGIFFFSLFAEAKRALRDIPNYRDDPEGFYKLYKGVTRILWR